MYSGKFTNENRSPKGEITSEKKLHCTIEKIGGYDDLNVKTKRINALHGIFDNKTLSFGSFVKKLSVRYTFLGKIRKFLFMERKTKLTEQPAATMEVDNPVEAVIGASLSGEPVSDVTINEKVYFSTNARLVSYFRAPINYVRHLVFERITKLLSCEGMLARSIRTLVFTRTVKATKGEGVIARSKDNTFYTSKEALAGSAPSDIQTLEHTMTGTSHEAVASSGGGADVVIDVVSAIGHTANLAFWYYPELVGDGELVLKQSYSAVQNNYELEVN